MVTRSGWSKLTNAYQSVMSAVRSRAVIGASRWLDASRLPGSIPINASNASMGRNRFGCMGVPLEGDFREYRIVGSTQDRGELDCLEIRRDLDFLDQINRRRCVSL